MPALNLGPPVTPDPDVFYRVHVTQGQQRIDVYYVTGSDALYIGWANDITGAINVVARHAGR